MKKEEIEEIEAKIRAADTDGTFTSMKLKSASVSAVVHRAATGKDEDLGYVAYYHRNPFIHYYMQLRIWIRGLIRKYGNSIS